VSKPHDVEVILVGDELLKGERRDAHLGWIGRALLPLGVRIARSHTVGDDPPAIAETVRECASRTRVLIVTGGLGPTKDDITRNGVVEGLGLELQFHESSWERIAAFFRDRGVEPSEANRQQAMFPAGAVVIENHMGTAPGFTVEHDGTSVFVLPGPPRELQPMMEAVVLPAIEKAFGRDPIRVETFRTIGVGESQLVEQFQSLFDGLSASRLSFLPSMFGVDVILSQAGSSAAMEEEVSRMETTLREGIGNKLYEHGLRDLAEVVHDRLIERGETLGIAESITGGMIGDSLIACSGASQYLLADAVTYGDESKRELLGVRPETITTHGAVSEETCTEMAHGIRNRTGATWGLATTGVAGPTGGTDKKPVGLVFFGIAFEDGSRIKRMRYRGNRGIIRERTARGALWLLFDRLQGD